MNYYTIRRRLIQRYGRQRLRENLVVTAITVPCAVLATAVGLDPFGVFNPPAVVTLLLGGATAVAVLGTIAIWMED